MCSHQTNDKRNGIASNYKIRLLLDENFSYNLILHRPCRRLKASLKWHEVDIWLLTHKAEKIMFRRMYSFVARQGGGDVTAVVTPAGHSGWSESASSERLIWFPSVLML
jgi:hypothetical protein